MKPTRITIWSLKGGVGKTTIALNLALDFHCGVITNERYTLLDKALEKGKFLKLDTEQSVPTIPKEHSIIFDMGGYIDKRVIEACMQSDYVIIPTTPTKLDLQGCIGTIQEIQEVNKNIIVVINRVDNEKDCIKAKALIKQIGDYPVFEIKKSRTMQNLIDEKQSISQIAEQGGLKGYMVQSLNTQWQEIINFITNK
jgi:cellulose biosynthesis protein BcsQ